MKNAATHKRPDVTIGLTRSQAQLLRNILRTTPQGALLHWTRDSTALLPIIEALRLATED